MIYENVKRLCEKHKTNIATVEKACGIANGTIGKWAGKDAAPRIDTVKAIADYFGVSVDSLLQKPGKRRDKVLLENIKKLCASRNISLSALEKTLGFGNSTIAKWANCSPTVEKLSLVADYFGVSVDSLLQKPGERMDTKCH